MKTLTWRVVVFYRHVDHCLGSDQRFQDCRVNHVDWDRDEDVSILCTWTRMEPFHV